jgi:hypothetical protein
MDKTAPGRRGVRARPGGRLPSRALIAALVLGVAACGAQQEQRSAQNLCARYQQLVARSSELQSLDPRSTTADAIQKRADTALATLDQLQAVSEGRYDALISSLRAAVNDVRHSAVEVGETVTTSAQQRQAALKDVAESLAPLKQRLDVECSTTP